MKKMALLEFHLLDAVLTNPLQARLLSHSTWRGALTLDKS